MFVFWPHSSEAGVPVQVPRRRACANMGASGGLFLARLNQNYSAHVTTPLRRSKCTESVATDLLHRSRCTDSLAPNLLQRVCSIECIAPKLLHRACCTDPNCTEPFLAKLLQRPRCTKPVALLHQASCTEPVARIQVKQAFYANPAAPSLAHGTCCDEPDHETF